MAQPRTRILSFCSTAILFFWVCMLGFRLGFHPPEWLALTIVMWHPAVLSFFWRLAGDEGFYDVGWQLGRLRFWGWAIGVPLVFGVFSYTVALALRKVAPVPDIDSQPMLDAIYFKLHWYHDRAPFSTLLTQRFVAVALVGMVPVFFLSLGEELAWRGYLLQRMLKAGYRHPILWNSIFWAIWHVPLLVLTGYGHGLLSLLLHSTLLLLFGVFICWLRLASGSVWVATMAHASFDGFMQCFFEQSFKGTDSWLWVSDYGILTLLPYCFLVFWLCCSGKVRSVQWTNKRFPATPQPVAR